MWGAGEIDLVNGEIAGAICVLGPWEIYVGSRSELRVRSL
jgi:hypothetical protein